MSSALETLRQRIEAAIPEETPDGLVCVIYPGKHGGVRLVVNREEGWALATDTKTKNWNLTRHQDTALAAMRALSAVVAGGVS